MRLMEKRKNINGIVDDKTQEELIKKKLVKKKHNFHIGDVVNFNAGLSGKGDKMVATNIQYLYNPALDVLINKAKTENNFIGYLKMIDDNIYVKEIDSYLFFPVAPSPWQMIPTEKELNEAVTFSLENTGNKEKVTAKLFNNNYIPEFYTAVKLFKSKTPVDAKVYKVSPHGIYLNIVSDKVQAKIPVTDPNVKIGDAIKVQITYLSPAKIVVEAL
ncbi:hypothetical protein [Ferruginibacter sp.]